MTTALEDSGVVLVEKILASVRESHDLKKKLKRIKLEWVILSSDTMPVLDIEFHSEKETWK